MTRKMEKVFFLNNAKERLAGILHLPEKPVKKVVIICHGFTGSKDGNFIPSLASFLARKGIAVLRFDFSGNGESQGKFSESSHFKQVKDLYAAVKFLKSKGFSRIGLVGHSMGGSVVLLAAAKLSVRTVVDICSPSKHEPERYKRYAWEWVRKRLSKKFFQDVEKVNIVKVVKKIKKPLLIVHGTADKIVNVRESLEIFKAANQPKTLFLIRGAGHSFCSSKHALKLFNAVHNWMKKWL